MSQLLIKFSKAFNKKNFWRIAIALTMVLIPLFSSNEMRNAFFQAISDAYLQVTVFVALTLAIFYSLENFFQIDTEAFLKKYRKFHVPIATLLGALPGCGGAIMVMTQYTLGRLGFGSVVAVLTATMGDAAFLLIARRPMDALIIFTISIFVGITFGYLVEYIHGYDFLRYEGKKPSSEPINSFFQNFGIADFTLWFGVVGAISSLLLWLLNPDAGTYISNAFVCHNQNQVAEKITAETCFVTVWVIIGYLSYELAVIGLGLDLKELFNSVQVLLPLMGVLIGFLPGCGPQVLVTTMYLQGLIPFSAQIGNAISNDGDALFPAIALAPKVSLIATIYTSIPALIFGYAYYFFFE